MSGRDPEVAGCCTEHPDGVGLAVVDMIYCDHPEHALTFTELEEWHGQIMPAWVVQRRIARLKETRESTDAG